MEEQIAAAPSGTDILRRLIERDEDIVNHLTANSATVMLINRYDDSLRRDLYAYIDTCSHDDLYRAGTLIVQSGHDANLIRAMLNTIGFYKNVLNHCEWGDPKESIEFLRRRYGELRLFNKESLTSRDYAMLKAAHVIFVAKIGSEDPSDVKKIADHIQSIELAVPVIMALDSLDARYYPSTSEVLDIARYVRSNIKDIERIRISVLERKGFDPEFLDIMLSKDRGTLDSGTL